MRSILQRTLAVILLARWPKLTYHSEAHTRGVDLKMPWNAVAALTLGIMQTKDHTVQGQSSI